MNRWRGIVACLGLYCVCATLCGESHCQFTLDATRQPVPPSRGMGPFPGSALPGHSAGFPVRLDLVVGTGKLEGDGTKMIDFVITNIGDEPIKLPVSVNQDIPHPTHVLTLYITIGGRFAVPPITSAEVYGESGNSQTFCLLARGNAMRVHASTRFRMTPGTHSLTAHAELLTSVEGRSELLGTAESISVLKLFSLESPAAR
jgi:hypothetical protein